jgi:hypothetical protein
MKMHVLTVIALTACFAAPAYAADVNVHVRSGAAAVETGFPGPYWFYHAPRPWGAYITTVHDRPNGLRCYSRLEESRTGWWVRHRRCERIH